MEALSCASEAGVDRRTARQPLGEREPGGEDDLAQALLARTAPDGEPLQIRDLHALRQGQPDVLGSVEDSVKERRVKIFGSVEDSSERIGHDRADVARSVGGAADPEEGVVSLAVVFEPLEDQDVLVDGVKRSGDSVFSSAKFADVDSLFLLWGLLGGLLFGLGRQKLLAGSQRNQKQQGGSFHHFDSYLQRTKKPH